MSIRRFPVFLLALIGLITLLPAPAQASLHAAPGADPPLAYPLPVPLAGPGGRAASRPQLMPANQPLHANGSAALKPPATPQRQRGLGGDFTWLLPDLQTLTPTDLRLLSSPDGHHKTLRFTNSVWNKGPGALEFIGALDESREKILITQVVYRLNQGAAGQRVGTAAFHPDHDHWHFDDFARYEIWSVTELGRLEARRVTSGKVGYCARDDRPVSYTSLGLPELEGNYPGRRFAHYTGCIWSFQGMSVGWQDIYRHHLEGQELDISALENGFYALVSTVNPRQRILEANLENNSNFVYFYLDGDRLQVMQP